MINCKTLRIAGAAILGTLVVTSPARALITVDANDEFVGAPTYAMESLTTPITVGNDLYYEVNTGASNLTLDVPLTVTKAAGQVLNVEFRVSGGIRMTSGSFNTDASLAIGLNDSAGAAVASIDDAYLVAPSSTRAVFSFGGAGVVAAANIIPRNTAFQIRFFIAELLIQPGVPGTVTVIVSNTTTGGTNTLTLNNPVKTMSALKVTTANAATTGELPVIAGVTYDFERFNGINAVATSLNGTLVGRLGQMDVDVRNVEGGTTTPLIAATGVPATLATLMVGASSRISGSGDLGAFVEDVYFDSVAGCDSASGTTSLLTGPAGSKTWKMDHARPQISAHVDDYVCIRVTGEDEIPSTAPYRVELDFTPLAGASFPPVDTGLQLGSINRDGASATLPYVTTSSLYNQRLVLTSTWNQDAEYTMTFTTEDGVTATPTMEATGTLAGGSVKVLRMTDLVEIDGGSRAAARVVLKAPSTTIDVATTQVRLSDGGTDTVLYAVSGTVN